MAEDRKPQGDSAGDTGSQPAKPSKGAASYDGAEPQVLEEPGSGGARDRDTGAEGHAGDHAGGHKEPPTWEIEDEPENPWLRGLWMLVLALLFGVGEFVLGVAALLQFLWLIFAREKNQYIADFGKDLADWLARVALFQTGTTDDKPFPFARWGKDDG